MIDIEFHNISFGDALTHWIKLWPCANNILPTSNLAFPESILDTNKYYSDDIGEPTFIGAFVDTEFVGVNSFFRTQDKIRSRGLYVMPEYRGLGIGRELLIDTMIKAQRPDTPVQMWARPNILSMHVFNKCGFRFYTPRFYDEDQQQSFHLVTTHSPH